MRAPKAENELERLAKLKTYQILDTAAEPSFERLTTILARMFNVPIALVSFVDERRQWFKSHVGLEASETDRSLSFCAYTILDRMPLVVPNALTDVRFSDNQLVTGPPHIRFYAGAPLVTNDGFALGSICLIDSVPRHSFSEQDRNLLQQFAGVVVDELERRLSRLRLKTAESELREMVASLQDREMQLRTSLLEQSALLQEVHHRVKNNLQLILSLLKLKSARSQRSDRDLVEMQQRVYSIALVHERLYSNSCVSSINFADYARLLVDEITQSFSPHRDVAWSLELQPTQFGVEQAIPCGLILNELVTNVLKHAYPSGRGRASVQLRELPDQRVYLSVLDHGRGLGQDIDLDSPLTMGFTVIHVLAEQLNAELTIEDRDGVKVAVAFTRP